MVRPADVERRPRLFLTLHELALRLARAAEKHSTPRFQFPSTFAVEFDDLSYWRAETDDEIARFIKRRPIEALAVEVAVSPFALESIITLHELRFLSVSEGTHFGDVEAAYLRELPLLQHLSLSGTGVTDAGLADIAQIRSLGGLDLAETKVTDRGVAQAVALSTLRILNLTGTQTGHWAGSLPADSQIEQLFLRRTAITNDLVDRLAKLPRLVRLDISRTAIDDSSLQSLSGSRTLQFLSIAETGVTDAGLRCLEDMPQLRCVDVSGTRVSFRGVRCLCEALPDCEVW